MHISKNWDPILEQFMYPDVPQNCIEISKMFHDLAHNLFCTLPASEYRHNALQALLEAKEAALVARI